jgi:hypothetical protein
MQGPERFGNVCNVWQCLQCLQCFIFINESKKWSETNSESAHGSLSFLHLPLDAGLPDGIFSNQKFLFGYIFGGHAMEDIGIFYGPLGLFTVI